VLTRGLLLTWRNYVTERIFGLRWTGFGRFTTGVSKERLDLKRAEYAHLMKSQCRPWPERLEFERMYSIRIKAPLLAVQEEIAKFGEKDRIYFTPHLIEVRRIGGEPNQPGCVIQYRLWPAFLSFNLGLESIRDQRYFIYRVLNGFSQGGVLIFEIEPGPKGNCLLSIYVVFDFFQGQSRWSYPLWRTLRSLFPAFIHDVLWNHALCRLKDNVESVADALSSARRG
jgi:hypothetical protein